MTAILNSFVPQRRVAQCSDIGYDPDDYVALALTGLLVDNLTVITADETRGRRARAARGLLDVMGRADVTVTAGRDLGRDKFIIDDLIESIPAQGADVIAAIARAVETGPISWVGQGPMSNLADYITARPQDAVRLDVVQQGGWLDPTRYRDPGQASYNLRHDPAAARIAIGKVAPRLVLSEFTGAEELLVTRESQLYKVVTAPGVPLWARWIATHLERWLGRPKPSHMHDPLAVSVALGLDFVQFEHVGVRIEADGRLYPDNDGQVLQVASGVDYARFMDWLTDVIANGIRLLN